MHRGVQAAQLFRVTFHSRLIFSERSTRLARTLAMLNLRGEEGRRASAQHPNNTTHFLGAAHETDLVKMCGPQYVYVYIYIYIIYLSLYIYIYIYIYMFFNFVQQHVSS